MSIRIVPQQQLETNKNKMSVVGITPLLCLPSPKKLFKIRAERFQHLAQDNPLAEYFYFCKKINELQDHIVHHQPVNEDLTQVIESAQEKQSTPLELSNYALTTQWQSYLDIILDGLSDYNVQIEETISQLKSKDVAEKQLIATHLLNSEFDKVDSRQALFIWAALSCYYTQLAAQLPGHAVVSPGESRQFCPVCHSHPIASVVHLGGQSGVRYLQCSLCETQWNVTRVKCTNCEDMAGINYYSLDKEISAIKTECCDNCHGYLKIFYQEQDPALDVVADDLASLLLDEETEKAGFAKTGLNPLLFP